ncbi:hypothetical protein FOCC_FOCC013463 [Frankliniella occidentalis]|nr:hypothetical protein FOCC_FOCC013463 [Frankliniella occidentalis]
MRIASFVAEVGGLSDVKVQMPQSASPGDDVYMRCLYNLDNDQLYTVKWYKGRQEFFRYVPKELPNTKVFPLPGVNVDVAWRASALLPLSVCVSGLVLLLEPLFPFAFPLGHLFAHPLRHGHAAPLTYAAVSNISFLVYSSSDFTQRVPSICCPRDLECVLKRQAQLALTQNLPLKRIGRFQTYYHVNQNLAIKVSLSDAHQVVLKSVRLNMAGKFRCEVSTDQPNFHTEMVAGDLHVAYLPVDESPLLLAEKQRYSVGDVLRANCTVRGAHPAANITWYLNDVKRLASCHGAFAFCKRGMFRISQH